MAVAALGRRLSVRRIAQAHLTASFSTSARRSLRELSTALEERDNVRTILSLSQQVRQHGGQTPKHPLVPATSAESATFKSSGARWWSKPWADMVQARDGGAPDSSGTTPVTLGGQPLSELSEAIQTRLRTPKRMMDSYTSFPLPFRSQPDVLEHYISSWGGVRVGKLLEDLDSLAGDASYRHVLGQRPTAADHEGNPIFIVTASVDRLDLLERLRSDRDYRLNGMVIYVGASSMEVLVTVEDVTDVTATSQSSGGRAVLTGRFTMATRNAATGKAQSIPPLQVENEAEKRLFAQGQSHKQRKKTEANTSLEKVPPTSDEASLLHELWLAEQQVRERSHATDASSMVHIEETRLSSVSYMHPQQRNVHAKVFGGYLMRSAYELAFMNALIFSDGRNVRFLSLDALSFHLPVSIGAILQLTSHISYTSTSVSNSSAAAPTSPTASVASVVVLAEVVDQVTGRRYKSNTFHFSFDVGPNAKRVLPKSYHDSIAFIEGKRRIDHGNEIRRISASA